MSGIVRIPHHTAGSTPEAVAGERLVAGAPMQTIANAYSDVGNAFHCGIWEGGVGAWRVSYSEHEFCHLLDGCVRLLGDDGSDVMLRPGDSFVIPAGFEGVWEVLEPARKLYAVYEPRA
ncbi:cupin domain-containing protein [Pseudoxanthomonas sacheonensis]|uniref:cupin domain-containing protein n=1 Tax=Pseudoxanthomonas sacheonensis TaxID=443615 RepID=UPI0013D00360|nr:cupin domain-containing protein [Pseudoxanthomonas sacheonensis]KAF1707556.1 transcriptional regulator [Pseudoxanthomonas sacheonensis]